MMTVCISGAVLVACGGDDKGKGSTGGSGTGGQTGTGGGSDGTGGDSTSGSTRTTTSSSGGNGGSGGSGTTSQGGTGGTDGSGATGGMGEGGMAGDTGVGGASVSDPEDFGSIDLSGIDAGECTGEVDAQIWTLVNENGLMAKLTDFGATLVELHVPDKDGVMADIVQGFDDVSGYANSQFAGATVGRVGNRIYNGTFSVDDTEYTVTGAGPADADPPNHSLHGGPCGWDKQMWSADAHMTDDGPEIEFSLTSADGDMNFPGEVMATSTYTLTNDNELRIVMTAEADAATPINMLHHSYFNLGGVGSGSVYLHELMINADQYTPPSNGVPDGTLTDVDGTPFDFTSTHLIGELADDPLVESEPGFPGYDHNWVVNGTPDELRMVAKVRDPVSGRTMTIEADQPGVQFYTTNYRPVGDSLEPTLGKNGVAYVQHEALALETQKHPNAINYPDDFDGAGAEDEIIRPEDDETYSHTMVHTFTIEE